MHGGTVNSRSISIDYLVGGLRISLGPDSTTPGPRNHITNFTQAAELRGHRVHKFVTSDVPGLTRFAKIREGSAGRRNPAVVLAGDLIRVLAMLWAGGAVMATSLRRPSPHVIYERLSVMQSLSSFHPRKRRAFRIVESNGIMSRETSQDRKALVLERLAAALERHAYRRADMVVAVSSALADEVARFAEIERSSVVVIPNAVPLGLPEATEKADLNNSIDGPILGFAGSVVEWQQLDLLLEAHGECGLDAPRIEIIGDGPELPKLKRLVNEMGSGAKVKFLGKLPQSDVYAAMSRWTIGFAGHKSTSSNQMYHSPLKLYEYAGLGLGVICTPSDDSEALKASGMPVWNFASKRELTDLLMSMSAKAATVGAYRLSDMERVQHQHSWVARVDQVLDLASQRGLQ